MNLQNVKNLTISEGTVKTIHDENNQLLWGALGYAVKYVGDTTQSGTPTPDFPKNVNVVTSEQTIMISDGSNTENFTIDLGSIELCKINTYQDYIYKSNDDWYVHKAIGKTILDGSETWVSQTSNTGYMYRLTLSGVAKNPATEVANLRSDYFLPANGTQIYNVTSGGYMAQLTVVNYVRFNIGDTTDKLSDFKVWLSVNKPILYYAFANYTDTKITDIALIEQLNAIHEWLIRYGYNGVATGNLPLIIEKNNL